VKRPTGAPSFHLVAGPNGAGKTTFAQSVLPRYAGTFHFLNPDLIASALAPSRPEVAAVSAGRVLLTEFHRLVSAKKNFAAESTLAGLWLVSKLDLLRTQGYRLCLYWLWLPSVELATARVLQRVRSGGHDVPRDTIRRRHGAGLRNLRRIYAERFDDVRLFDNAGLRPRLVARRQGDRWDVKDPEVWGDVMKETP
jgi:predicted ABC-type ATPase